MVFSDSRMVLKQSKNIFDMDFENIKEECYLTHSVYVNSDSFKQFLKDLKTLPISLKEKCIIIDIINTE